jgi:hypothetical protein
MPITNEQRFKNWIAKQKAGTTFTIREITGKLNIDNALLGHYVKYFTGIRKGAVYPGNIQEYIIPGEGC